MITHGEDVQKKVNREVKRVFRERYPGEDVPKMSSPIMRLIAAELGVLIGTDGRIERTPLNKPESTDGFVGSTVWGRVAVGLVRVCGPARFGACEAGVRGWCGWWRVGCGCAAPGAQRRVR